MFTKMAFLVGAGVVTATIGAASVFRCSRGLVWGGRGWGWVVAGGVGVATLGAGAAVGVQKGPGRLIVGF